MCVQWVKALGESRGGGENLRMSSGRAANRESTPPRAAVRPRTGLCRETLYSVSSVCL